MAETSHFRVNYALAVIPDTDSDEALFAIENLNEQEKHPISDVRIVEMLDFARDWITRPELESKISDTFEVDNAGAESLVDSFIERSFLVTDKSELPRFEENGRKWLEYNWTEALEHYLYIREYPYIDYSEGKEAFEEDFGRMEDYAEREEIPPLYKTYDEVEQIELLEISDDLDLPSIGESLSFTDTPVPPVTIDRERLSQVLSLTFGETGRVSFPHQGEFLLKTSPSGGARHPTEAYIAVFDVENVPDGLYHYSVKDHALDVLKRGDIEPDIRDAVYELDMHPTFDISFVIFLSSVVERSMWRYREPRSYSVIQNDIGHLLETLRLICNANGLETTYGHGFDDSELAALLDLDRFEEPLFKYAPVGL